MWGRVDGKEYQENEGAEGSCWQISSENEGDATIKYQKEGKAIKGR
jgi:hypothetical protein